MSVNDQGRKSINSLGGMSANTLVITQGIGITLLLLIASSNPMPSEDLLLSIYILSRPTHRDVHS